MRFLIFYHISVVTALPLQGKLQNTSTWESYKILQDLKKILDYFTSALSRGINASGDEDVAFLIQTL